MTTTDALPQVTGPEVSRELFGGVLDYDGAGYYPGLELVNFVFRSSGDGLLPADDPARLVRAAQDFARRLVWDETFHSIEERREVFLNDRSEDAVRRLLECLELEIPSIRKRPTWERAHFFPYSRSLIHWDARHRYGRISLERRYLRGGGALAYRVLRKDPDSTRLDRCRDGFQGLFSHNQVSALEELVEVLSAHGFSDDEAVADEVEGKSRAFDDKLDDLYRDGTVNLLGHFELPRSARIRALTNWTALWLIILQHSRASAFLGAPPGRLICDCSGDHPQLRRASQRCLRDRQATILEAVQKSVKDKNAQISSTQLNKIRGFFWASAATIGLLNSWTGRRHFLLGLHILEPLVLAATESTDQISFEEFTYDWLFGRCGLVVSRRAAEECDLLKTIDASVFEDNEAHLADQMKAAGLLVEYSDATRMVGSGGLR